MKQNIIKINFIKNQKKPGINKLLTNGTQPPKNKITIRLDIKII